MFISCPLSMVMLKVKLKDTLEVSQSLMLYQSTQKNSHKLFCQALVHDLVQPYLDKRAEGLAPERRGGPLNQPFSRVKVQDDVRLRGKH